MSTDNQTVQPTRIPWGNDFTTLTPYRAIYVHSREEVDGFDMSQCTDMHVRVAKLNHDGRTSKLWDVSEFGRFSVLAGNILRIDWSGLKMQIGTFAVEFLAKYDGHQIRSYSTVRVKFDIVETNEEASIPDNALLENSTYILDGELLLMLGGGIQSDWEQDNPNAPDYIKNRPDLDLYQEKEEGKGLSEEDFTTERMEKLDDIDAEPITNLELEAMLI